MQCLCNDLKICTSMVGTPGWPWISDCKFLANFDRGKGRLEFLLPYPRTRDERILVNFEILPCHCNGIAKKEKILPHSTSARSTIIHFSSWTHFVCYSYSYSMEKQAHNLKQLGCLSGIRKMGCLSSLGCLSGIASISLILYPGIECSVIFRRITFFTCWPYWYECQLHGDDEKIWNWHPRLCSWIRLWLWGLGSYTIQPPGLATKVD